MELFQKGNISEIPNSNDNPQLCEDIVLVICEDTSSDKVIQLFDTNVAESTFLTTDDILTILLNQDSNEYRVINDMNRESIFSEKNVLTKDGDNYNFYYIPEGQHYLCRVRYIRQLTSDIDKYEIGYSYRMSSKNLLFDSSIHIVELTKDEITDKIKIQKLAVNDTRLPPEFERFAFNVEHFSQSTPQFHSKEQQLKNFLMAIFLY